MQPPAELFSDFFSPRAHVNTRSIKQSPRQRNYQTEKKLNPQNFPQTSNAAKAVLALRRRILGGRCESTPGKAIPPPPAPLLINPSPAAHKKPARG